MERDIGWRKASKAYALGQDTGRFVEKLVIALLDQVVVLPQIDGIVQR